VVAWRGEAETLKKKRNKKPQTKAAKGASKQADESILLHFSASLVPRPNERRNRRVISSYICVFFFLTPAAEV
jgi:hypothetical protein